MRDSFTSFRALHGNLKSFWISTAAATPKISICILLFSPAFLAEALCIIALRHCCKYPEDVLSFGSGAVGVALMVIRQCIVFMRGAGQCIVRS